MLLFGELLCFWVCSANSFKLAGVCQDSATREMGGSRAAAREATKLGLLLAATVLASPPTAVLEVNGAATKLDALGPVVVGKDGSLGLISGWADLSPQEKEAGLAHVTRRNAKRLAQLKQAEAARDEAERRRGPVARLARRALQWGIGVARRFRCIRRPAKLASAPASTATATSTSTSTATSTPAAVISAICTDASAQ